MQIQNIRQPRGKCIHILNTHYFVLLPSLCSDFRVPVTIATDASKLWQQGKMEYKVHGMANDNLKFYLLKLYHNIISL
jgi:hypothetical protein